MSEDPTASFSQFETYRTAVANATTYVRNVMLLLTATCVVVATTLYSSYPNNWTNSRIGLYDNVVRLLENPSLANSADSGDPEVARTLKWMEVAGRTNILSKTRDERLASAEDYRSWSKILQQRRFDMERIQLPGIPTTVDANDLGVLSGALFIALMVLLAVATNHQAFAMDRALAFAARCTHPSQCLESLALYIPFTNRQCIPTREGCWYLRANRLVHLLFVAPLLIQSFILIRYDIMYRSGWYVSPSRLLTAIIVDSLAVIALLGLGVYSSCQLYKMGILSRHFAEKLAERDSGATSNG